MKVPRTLCGHGFTWAPLRAGRGGCGSKCLMPQSIPDWRELPMTRLQSFLISLATLAVLSFAVPCSAHAATKTWDGGVADDSNWMTATNWVGDIAPVAGDDLDFGGTNDLSPNNNFAVNTSFS